MDSVIRGINDVVLAYFFAINLVYTLLLRHLGARVAAARPAHRLRRLRRDPALAVDAADLGADARLQRGEHHRAGGPGPSPAEVRGVRDRRHRRRIHGLDAGPARRGVRPREGGPPAAAHPSLSSGCRAVYISRRVANLIVVAKENGGKADALNAGINATRFPLFCAIDADAILERDALLRVVKPFMERPRETVASSGIVRVVNGCDGAGRDGDESPRAPQPPRRTAGGGVSARLPHQPHRLEPDPLAVRHLGRVRSVQEGGRPRGGRVPHRHGRRGYGPGAAPAPACIASVASATGSCSSPIPWCGRRLPRTCARSASSGIAGTAGSSNACGPAGG